MICHILLVLVQLSRRSKITLAVLAGVSLSILAAGYLLRQRRRKYRPVAPRTTARAGLYRNNTFKEDHHRQTEGWLIQPVRDCHLLSVIFIIQWSIC